MRWAFGGTGLLRGSPDSDGDTDVAIECSNGQAVIKVQIRAELMFRYAGPDIALCGRSSTAHMWLHVDVHISLFERSSNLRECCHLHTFFFVATVW